MSVMRARDRIYQRRLGYAVAAALALHAAAWFLPSPLRQPTPVAIPDSFQGLGLIDVLVAAGEAAATSSSPQTTSVPAEIAVTQVDAVPVAQPEIEVTPEASPEPLETAALASQPPSFGVAGGADSAVTGTGAGAGGASSGGIAPGMQILVPRTTVHPRTPDIVRKRKIDDFVLLELLVGIDGRVEEVRVSHPIERCEECTANAIEVARKFVYEPPMHDGRPVRAWTTFSFAFTYANKR